MHGRKAGIFFPAFLGAVVALFVGLLIWTWYGANEAAPVILDEKGNVRN